jgi:hypothetical protein
VTVGAFFSKATVALLGEVSADFDTFLIILGGFNLGFLGLVTWATTTTTTTTSLRFAILLIALLASILLVADLLFASYVLVLASISKSALSSLLEHAAHLLFATGVLSFLGTVSVALVLTSMDESASITKTAGLVLSPVVAISLGLVVTLRDRDSLAFRMLVLAGIAESAFAVIVAEGSANLLLVGSAFAFSVSHDSTK